MGDSIDIVQPGFNCGPKELPEKEFIAMGKHYLGISPPKKARNANSSDQPTALPVLKERCIHLRKKKKTEGCDVDLQCTSMATMKPWGQGGSMVALCGKHCPKEFKEVNRAKVDAAQ